jgi:N-methylhydantoinase A
MRAGDAARHAARLVLSGPAGGVIGAAFVARRAGFNDVISYDMGGTSTDVATVLDGQPQWTTRSAIDGLPIGLPMFEINTVGAGGGSIAYADAGGALRVGPRSAGAEPGPACYGRGGTEPTVTDANVVLGRILPDRFLGGAMRLDVDAAHGAIERLARQLGKSVTDTALGVVTVVESNMAHAVRAVTSRRGHDPRGFALVSFGGAGGLHACGLAGALDIARVLVPPYCGVLSALGMVVAPPVVDVSQSVVDRADQLDDGQVARAFDDLASRSARELPDALTKTIQRFADVRFRGQSHEVAVPIARVKLGDIEQSFHATYRALYGQLPGARPMQIVSLRLRRIGRAVDLMLPPLAPLDHARGTSQVYLTVDPAQRGVRCDAVARAALLDQPPAPGPLLIIDSEATSYVPPGWTARTDADGSVLLVRAARNKNHPSAPAQRE